MDGQVGEVKLYWLSHDRDQRSNENLVPIGCLWTTTINNAMHLTKVHLDTRHESSPLVIEYFSVILDFIV